MKFIVELKYNTRCFIIFGYKHQKLNCRIIMQQQKNKKKKRILRKGHDKYDKIAYRQKMFLLKGVFIDKTQIKETAQHLGINYSTAKTFLRKFKAKNTSINVQFITDICNWFSQLLKSNSRCSYKVVGPQSTSIDDHDSPKEFVKEEKESEEGVYRFLQDEQNDSQRPRQVQIIQQVLFKD